MIKHARDFFEILILVLFSLALIYFAPPIVSKLFFLLLLVAVWRSNKDYFWLAFFIILIDEPGGFFSGGAKDDLFRLPLYTLTAGLSFSIFELYILMIFAKTFIYNKRLSHVRNYFSNDFRILALLMLVLIVYSFFAETSFDSLVRLYKSIISLLVFYWFLRVINSWNNLILFFKAIFPFVFIALFLQAFSLNNGAQLISLLKTGIITTQGEFDTKHLGLWERPIEMVNTLFLCFVGSLLLMSKKERSINSTYLLIINVLAFLSILLTGTRSWTVAFLVAYIIYFIHHGFKINLNHIRFIPATIIVFIIMLNIPVFNKQLDNAWSRIETVFEIKGGSFEESSARNRYAVRAPKVMEGFENSSIIFGAGFSDLYNKYADGHVGYHNILLNVGILGSIIFLAVFIHLLMFPYLYKLGKNYNKDAGILIKISTIPIIILLLANVGTQTIGFSLESQNRYILLAFSMHIINLIINSTQPQSLISQQKQLGNRTAY